VLRWPFHRSGNRGERPGSSRLPLKVTACYLVCGFFFLAVAERFIHPNFPAYLDDAVYIVATAFILYFVVRRGVKTLRAKECALLESEDRLARILETNASGVVVFDAAGRITFANHTACRILGVDRAQIVGLRHDDPAWHLTDADGAPISPGKYPVERVRATGMPLHDDQVTVRHANGARVFLTVNAAPLLGASGSMVGVVASFVDITERKKMEDLKVRKLLLAVEQSPSAIVITDLDGNVEYANPRYALMSGCTVKEAIEGKMPHPCMIPEAHLEEMRSAVRLGKEWRGEFGCHRKSSETYWESTTMTPIRTAEGESTGLLWVREDITEHRLAEQALREAREKFQNLVETVSDLVWEVDRNGVYTYVSPKVRDLLGYEPGEIVGKTPFDLMPDVEARLVKEIFDGVIARREPFHGLENVNLHKDGNRVVIETSGAPFFDADGNFRGYRGVDRDIGERKRVEEMLRVSEERFRRLFEQSEEPQILFRKGTAEILDANPAATKLHGHSLEDLLRGGLALFVPPEDLPGFSSAVANIHPGAGLNVARAIHLRKDGARIVVSARGYSIVLGNGEVAFCSFRDITARIQMEEEAKLHQAQLIHANRMASLGTIVSGVAHEVNNPNNLIMFNAPMILSAWDDAVPILEAYFRENGDFSLGGLPYSEMREVVPRLARGISDASLRIKGIVGNLKDFARQDRAKGHAPVQINDVVRTSVAILNHEILKATHRFDAELGKGIPPVSGSSQELEQVLINLMNNALQALPSSRHGLAVKTLWNPGTGEVEVHVADEGVGMSPEVLERTKEPFFSTRLDSGGLGLGLSICRSIVKDHRGTLAFESHIGKGTVAIVRLPVLADAVSPGAASPAASRMNVGG
jgi:hypothetical protein